MILLFNFWIIFTFSLYVFSFASLNNVSGFLVGFIFLCLTFLNTGYFFGVKSLGFYNVKPSAEMAWLSNERFYLFSCLLYFFSSIYLFSVQVPHGLFDVLFGSVSNPYVERQESYDDIQRSLHTAGSLYYVAVMAKSLSFLPLLLGLYFYFSRNKFSFVGKLLIATFFLSQSYGALIKGSSKEVFDLVFVLSFFWLVGQGKNIRLINIFKIIIIPIFVFIIFLYQQIARASISFFDVDFLFIFEFASRYVVSYLAQGYHGLSLILGEESDFAFGLGHLDVLRAIFQSANIFPHFDSLADVLDTMGWKKGLKWSSMYTGLVDDFGWIGVLFYIFFIGLMFGASIKTLRRGRNGFAAVCLLLLSYLLFFSSMNFQIGLTLHWTFVYLFLVSLSPFMFKGFK